jgi:hypothetical protein
MLEEAKEINKTWAEIKAEAKNRLSRKNVEAAVCFSAE